MRRVRSEGKVYIKGRGRWHKDDQCVDKMRKMAGFSKEESGFFVLWIAIFY